jgi:hypothetical protein
VILFSTTLAADEPKKPQPISVVAMSLDPPLLTQAGLSVEDLKSAAVGQLQAAGIAATTTA